MTNCFSIRIY